LGCIDAPGSRQKISGVRDRSDRNDAVDRRRQADTGLLRDMLAVMLQVALEAQPVVHSPVGSHAFEVSVSAHIADTVFQMRIRRVDAQANLFFRAKSPTEIA